MNRITRTVAAVLATAFLCTTVLAASPEDMVKGAKGLEAAFLKAFNEQNSDALMACYWNNPECVLMPPDMLVVKGPEAIKAAFVQMAATMKGCHLSITESHHMPMGDVVLSHGLFNLTMPGPDGQPMNLTGRFSDVKAQKDGKWVYIVDHASMPAPPPPMPEAAPKQE